MTENELTPLERHQAIQKYLKENAELLEQHNAELSEKEILIEATNRYTIEDEIEAFIQGAEWAINKLKNK